jgi:plastocyanin
MHPRRPVLGALVVAATGIAIAGCSGDDEATTASEPPASFEETVTIAGSGYRPEEARVLVGGSVTWINRDPESSHTAETEPGRYEALPGGEDVSFDTHTLSWGEPYTVTFHKPGTYSYLCAYHSEMKGTVEVVEREPPRR